MCEMLESQLTVDMQRIFPWKIDTFGLVLCVYKNLKEKAAKRLSSMVWSSLNDWKTWMNDNLMDSAVDNYFFCATLCLS